MKVQKYKGITGTLCDCPKCVKPKPEYYIRINGYDIRKFTHSEYTKYKKRFDKDESYDSETLSYEYCISNNDHIPKDSWGWHGINNIIIASDIIYDFGLSINIYELISDGTSYSDIKQRIDLIVDIGNAVMKTLNKR